MSTIRTSIMINDGMTSAMKSMNNALNIVLNSFEALQGASSSAIDTSSIRGAREELARAEITLNQIEGDIRQSSSAQEEFNNSLRRGDSAADSLGSKMSSILKTTIGLAGIKMGFNWGKGSLSSYDVQNKAETQLASVMKNVGSTEQAFNSLKETASSIQSKTLFGDELMIGGAAEIATYIQDPEAIKTMMNTLANYATGMSGGGEVSQTQMVDYATQLGKVTMGAFDGIKKKGFELSDAQKKIIENGTDMEKALTIDEIISESWENLAENMANTPQGTIQQVKNTIGDIREEVGSRLYPTVLKFLESIKTNMPQIQTLMLGFANVLNVLISILTKVAGVFLMVAKGIQDNWSMISPIIYGIVAALVIYSGALIAHNAVQAISNIQKVFAAAAAYNQAKAVLANASAHSIETVAIARATVAQTSYNATLLACPLTWIIVAIIALIVLFYAAVGAVNKFSGTSLSATGLICGAFMAVLAVVGNVFVSLWNVVFDVMVLIYNLVATVANFIGNVFNDPIGAIAKLFFDLADTVLGILETLANAIDTIFGSNLAGAVSGWRNSLGGWVEDTFGKGEEVMAKITSDEMKLGRFEYGAAINMGNEFGKGIENKISGLFDFDSLAFDWDSVNGIYAETADIAKSTAASANSMELSNEYLKYLREAAEREAINNFTTVPLQVYYNSTNNVNSKLDLDGMISEFGEKLVEAVYTSAEVVHV